MFQVIMLKQAVILSVMTSLSVFSRPISALRQAVILSVMTSETGCSKSEKSS